MHNLLIISDIHLCHEKPTMIKGWQRKLSSFLTHYAQDGLRYRLVIGGDFFDLDYQTDSIQQRGPEEESIKLVTEVLHEFSEVFTALSTFLEAGNEVVILTGNHDLDLSWSGVHGTIADYIQELGTSAEAIARLSFKQWFYYEPGRVYIEHGLQYDPDLALCGILDPRRIDEEAFRLTIGSCWLTDFCPLIPEMAYHVDHTRGPIYYIPEIIKYYGLRGPELWMRYLAFTWRTLLKAGPKHLIPRPEHTALLKSYAIENGLRPEQAEAIEALAEPPRLGSRIATAARLHMVVGHLLPVSMMLAILWRVFGSATLGWAALGSLGVALSTSILFSGRFHGDAPGRLKLAAGKIQELLGVPLVVFGHVHEACEVPTPAGGLYINSGTWMSIHQPATYIKLLAGEAPKLLTWNTEA